MHARMLSNFSHVRVFVTLWTVAWETASQIALRECSKAAIGKGFGEGGVQCHEALILQKVFVSHEDLMSP